MEDTSKKLTEQVDDYKLTNSENEQTNLSKLFGTKKDLILIHNMGTSCPYCTMWADGLNGLLTHLEDRAKFVVSSPDDPSTQKEFASARGWKFQMVSTRGTSFAKDMGFEKNGMPMPGVSVFYKDGEKILRVGRDDFGPGDKYCPTFPLFDLLKDGPNNWEAKFEY